MASPPHQTSISGDWVYEEISDAHVARDRAWFKTYTPLVSILSASDDEHYVVGIGTIDLPADAGHGECRFLTLKNVLHVPSFSTNLVSGMRLTTHTKLAQELRSLPDGAILALRDREKHHWCLKLRFQPLGTVLEPSRYAEDAEEVNVPNAAWPSVERTKYTASAFPAQSFTPKLTPESTGSFTAAELERMEVIFSGPATSITSGSEAERFCTALSIPLGDDEESRGIARAIARLWLERFEELDVTGILRRERESKSGYDELIADYEEDRDEWDEEEADEYDSAFEPEIAENPAAHMADFQFSEPQLEWIEAHYGTSFNFMTAYGLNVFKDEQVEIAKSIVDDCMREEGEEA